MRSPFSPWFGRVVIGLLGCAVVLSAGAQWRTTLRLRAELQRVRVTDTEVQRAQAENARWRSEQVSSDQLAAWREDHVALERLRTELAALRAGKP